MATSKGLNTLLVPVLMLVCAAVTHAATKTMYKWEDAQGVVHYSDVKPAGIEAEAIKTTVRSSSSSPAAASPASRSGSDAESTNTADPGNANGSGPAEDPEALKDPERCEVAKKNLETINNNSRIRIRDPETNEYRYLSEKEIQEHKDRAQKAIDESC